MPKLSVNVNKIATLRNTRSLEIPSVTGLSAIALDAGAQGITVHPRPDERHIRYRDVFDLKKIVTTEFNIEGNCQEQKFVDLVLANKPEQVTLVPDILGQITSNHGWDTITNQDYLKYTIAIFNFCCVYWPLSVYSARRSITVPRKPALSPARTIARYISLNTFGNSPSAYASV